MGYGDYTPVTTIGRIIAVVVMFSGIGIVVSILGFIAQRRLQRVESRFKSKTEVQSRLVPDEEGQKSITLGGQDFSGFREVLQEGTQFKHVQDIIHRVCVCTCAPRLRENRIRNSRRRSLIGRVISLIPVSVAAPHMERGISLGNNRQVILIVEVHKRVLLLHFYHAFLL